MKSIRGGSGFGDSVYLRPIVDALSEKEEIVVCSNYPDVFRGSKAKVEPFRRTKIDITAHYVYGKGLPNTTQWYDTCRAAGIYPAFKFHWDVVNADLVSRIKGLAAGKPIVVVHGGRPPMGRTDGFGGEILPRAEAFGYALKMFSDCLTVLVGSGKVSYTISTDVDLWDLTSVADVIDLFSIADGVIAQCSFAVPLAEAFDKCLVAVWSSRIAQAGRPYVRAITPQKILSKNTSWFVMDNWTEAQIKEEVRAIRLVC